MNNESDYNLPPLHPLEKRTLRSLADGKPIDLQGLAAKVGMQIDQMRRVTEWLKIKGLIDVKNEQQTVYELGIEGKRAVTNGLPEERLANTSLERGPISIVALKNITKMDDHEFNAALGRCIKNGWLSVNDGMVKPLLTEPVNKISKLLQVLSASPQSSISTDYKRDIAELIKRPSLISERNIQTTTISIKNNLINKLRNLAIDEETTQLKAEHISSGRWRNLKFSEIDITLPAPTIFPAKIHPLTEFIREIREIMVSIGFVEVNGPLVQPAFWNFDVLFTPQDHPARELQDTFYMKDIVEELNDRRLERRVSRTHENGWETGSDGWHYRWDRYTAKRAVLRTHMTAITVKALYELGDTDPKIFAIGKVFRNEKVDFKHLVELYQLDGLAVDSDLTFRNLMGYLSIFYKKLGFDQVKFWPTYFPYTEPSAQSMVYSKELNNWVELCGMGMIRPEVALPLGIKKPILAWGMGLERLLMLRLGVEDIRELYRNKLSWLRSRKCL